MLKGGDTAGASVNVSCGSFRITARADDKLSAGRSGAPGMLAHKGQTESQFRPVSQLGPELRFGSAFQFGPYTITTLPRELSDRTTSGFRCTVILHIPT